MIIYDHVVVGAYIPHRWRLSTRPAQTKALDHGNLQRTTNSRTANLDNLLAAKKRYARHLQDPRQGENLVSVPVLELEHIREEMVFFETLLDDVLNSHYVFATSPSTTTTQATGGSLPAGSLFGGSLSTLTIITTSASAATTPNSSILIGPGTIHEQPSITDSNNVPSVTIFPDMPTSTSASTQSSISTTTASTLTSSTSLYLSSNSASIASSPTSNVPSTLSSASSSEAHQATASSTNAAYKFNADASDNVAVYFGQSDATGRTNLTRMCQDSNVDIVVLAFLVKFFGPGGYPSINFGAACGGQNPEMRAHASGLLDCGVLASQIATCQSLGKKVLLSLGGYVSTTSFQNDTQATKFAETLWDLFGAGTDLDPGLRPFGKVKIDGFDIGMFT